MSSEQAVFRFSQARVDTDSLPVIGKTSGIGARWGVSREVSTAATSTGRRSRRRAVRPEPEDAWLVDVAQGASRDAGGVPVDLLGEYLSLAGRWQLCMDAGPSGASWTLSACSVGGPLSRGFPAGRVVQLYFSGPAAVAGPADGCALSRPGGGVRRRNCSPAGRR